MTPTVDARVTKLREIIRKEREAIAKLNDRAGELKPMMAGIEEQLDFVELAFLSKEEVSKQRTVGEWSFWLGGAERFLKHAAELRDYYGGLIDKHGPNLRSFGD
jgi:hypothetical protein